MGGLITGSGTTCHPLSVRGDDYYKTPGVAVHALLGNFPIPQVIYEPACGDGAIVNILRATERTVYASDIVDRGCPDSFVADFFTQEKPIDGVQAILTNPPFRYAHEFVRKSRELYPMTIMLLRFAFLESMRRSDILDQGDLMEVLLFRNRLPFMHRVSWIGKKHSNSGMPMAWLIWSKDWQQPPKLKRISWSKT